MTNIQNKIFIDNDCVFKFNTSRSSNGFEWITEFLSINHGRELRVYNLYNKKLTKFLRIPTLLESNNEFIKIQKIVSISNKPVDSSECQDELVEFCQLGNGEKMSLSDYLSSPTQSLIRGSLNCLRFYGFLPFILLYKNLFRLLISKSLNDTYLSHKDLKRDQNIMRTEKGIYFFDFGSSILTKKYFLIDIVEMSSDFQSFNVDFESINTFIKKMNIKNCELSFLRSQIYLLLMRRCLHFHNLDKKNPVYMKKAKLFVIDLHNKIFKENFGQF